MSGAASVVVVDINGVLGDVSNKKAAGRPKADAMLPSGQYFYLNPNSQMFLRTLERTVPLVLWTSRLRKNAGPIEHLPAIKDTRFIAMMHGEDCVKTRVGGYHPVKRVGTLRERLPPDLRNASIIFVDDSPKYVETDGNSSVLYCESYTAAEDNSWNLEEIVCNIQSIYGIRL